MRMRVRVPVPPMPPPLHLRDGRHGHGGRGDIDGDFLLDHDERQDLILVRERRVHGADDGLAGQQRVGGRGWCGGWGWGWGWGWGC